MPKQGRVEPTRTIPAAVADQQTLRAFDDRPVEPFWTTSDGQTVRLYLGDVVARLRGLPERSVQTVVTSPPYWGLRRYLAPGTVLLRDDLPTHVRESVLAELRALGVDPL